jgi:hypothetical protein
VSIADAVRLSRLESRLAEVERRIASGQVAIDDAPSDDPSQQPEETEDRCERRRGGKTQRFCTPEHRTAFHALARRLAEHAVTLGLLRSRRCGKAPRSNVHVAGEA